MFHLLKGCSGFCEPSGFRRNNAVFSLVKIFSRSRQDLAGKSRRPNLRHDLAAILAKIAARWEISAAKNVLRASHYSRRDRGEIWKSWQANARRDVAARSQRDTEISADSFTARSRWESCQDSRRETKFLAVKILLLSHLEAHFSAAKIGLMRT